MSTPDAGRSPGTPSPGRPAVYGAGPWYVGTSGWNYAHWKGDFYPAGLRPAEWLPHYAARFDTVEVNNSFYRLPASETFAHWREQTPPEFLFSVKATRYLTHRKKLNEPAQPLHNLISRAQALGPKLGPILYQLPPRWRANLDRLREFLEILPAEHRHVFEFRDPSWQSDAIFSLLDAHGCGYCIMSAPALPCHLVRTGGFLYLRMHGASPQHDGSYPDEELAWWLDRLRDLGAGTCDTYVYFNNDWRGHAIRNAQRMMEMIREARDT